MSVQDWDNTTINKKNLKNKKHSQIVYIAQKTVMDNVEEPSVKYIDKAFSQEMINLRLEKKLNRAELAKALNLSEPVIAEYENCTAVYNPTIISKIKKYLNMHK
jgi:ribosome-binding protein aMBF1 (putative translation factor)